MRRLLLFGLVLVLLGGCTMKATYNRLDWVLAKYLGSYVELSDSQKALLKQQLAETLEWHRSSQLTAYAEWLGDIRDDVEHGLTVEEVEQHGQELMVFWRSLMVHFADDLAVLLPRLTPEQREALLAKLEKDSLRNKQKTVHVSLEKQQELYAERLGRGLNRWLGRLNDQQEALIQVASTELKSTEAESMQMREHILQEFQGLLEGRSDKDEMRKAMRILLVDAESRDIGAYQQKFEHNRQIITQLIVDVAAVMDDRQKTYLYQQIDKYRKLFSDLAQQGVQRQAAQ